MNWQDLAGPLVKAGAPAIGTMLGGPLGGLIGQTVGGRRWRKLIERITSALILAGVVSFSGVLATLVYAGFRITIK